MKIMNINLTEEQEKEIKKDMDNDFKKSIARIDILNELDKLKIINNSKNEYLICYNDNPNIIGKGETLKASYLDLLKKTNGNNNNNNNNKN